MHKRGVSQIDWVISLAIFLLYVAWFFIFIRPLAVQQEIPNLVENVKERIHEQAYWSVFSYPVIIESSFYLPKEPIMVEFSYANQSNLFMTNKSFFLVADKLFFLNDVLSGTTTASIIYSNETYDSYNQITDLIADNQSASAGGMFVEMENSMVKTADFDGTKILSYNLYSNSIPVNSSNTSFSGNVAALYSINMQSLNTTTMIFGHNPRIYTLFEGSSSILQKFEIDKYDNYFFSNNNNGGLSAGGCYNDNSDMIEFYSGSSVMLFVLSKNASISFCGNNNSISLQISFNLNSPFLQKIIFYEGSPDDYIKYKNPYTATMGIPEITTALSLFNLKLLNATNYNNLKNRWDVGDFRVTVTNATNGQRIIDFGGVPYEKATVYAEESRNFLLDKYDNLEDVKINIQSWT